MMLMENGAIRNGCQSLVDNKRMVKEFEVNEARICLLSDQWTGHDSMTKLPDHADYPVPPHCAAPGEYDDMPLASSRIFC